jgi:hypothetical protein
MLVIELKRRFVDSKLMNAFDIVYPQFWMQPYEKNNLSLNISVIKRHYCELKKVKPSLDQVIEPLSVNLLDMQ